tara:strand:+ start:809 stop:1891 length:1083 start_codon:yes stop_codon:yes gene_type:complete
MADFKVNHITGKQGQQGTVLAGVTTVSSTGAMRIPSGSSAYRGNSGRGIFSSGWTLDSVKNIDYINIASTGNSTAWGEIITAGMALAGGASNNIRGVYCGGFTGSPTNARLSTIQALTIPTEGEIIDFGDLQFNSQQLSGVGNATRGVYANGYAYPNMSPVSDSSLNMTYTMIEFMSSANRTDFGDIIDNAACRDLATCETPIRGYFAGGEGTGQDSPSHNKNITIKGFANNSESLTFGELSTLSQRGSAVGSSTRGCFIIGSTIPALTNTIEYITLTTSGETTDFGDATSNADAMNNNSASNTIRGVYHIGRSAIGGAVLNTLEYITIATTGNAQDFGDLNYVSRSGCGLSDSHGGLSH